MSRVALGVSAAALAVAALLGAGTASAQSSELSANNWRQRGRPHQDEEKRSPQSFAFEVRFGPYYPEVDEEFGFGYGEGGPYARTFGEVDGEEFTLDPQFYFGIEADWQAFRIPYVGAIGPGFGWGFTTTSAPAKISSTGEDSAAETSLTIMPMHLSLVLRVDDLMRRTGFPIVPYGKIGLGMATWTAGVDGDQPYEDPATGEEITSSGVTWGMHMALGGMLALNWLDGRAAAALDETSGVNHAYVFGEWMNASLDGIGSRPQMHVGSSTWVVGLAFDM